MTLPFHDYFAGIGGSSNGLRMAGMVGVVALNHWQYAVEVHNANHPDMDHDLADIWLADPRRYRPAEVGWFSPECRAHSQAKGKKRYGEHYATDLWRNPTTDPADDRSRLLMESVPYISGLAGYRYVLVENVVEVVKWVHFNRWLEEMRKLDYQWKLLFLNSQFFGTPQSRDRFFAVFWKRGMPVPDLEFRPAAHCERCGQIEAVQAWKPGRWYGKYGRQYLYVCPTCAKPVKPETVGAERIIDWSLPITRIGDRPDGLSPLTIAKIKYGLERFGKRSMIVDTAYAHAVNKARPADEPLFTQTRQQSLALTVSYYGRENAVKLAGDPLPVVPTEPKIGVALITSHYGRENAVSDAQMPLPSVLSQGTMGLAYIETLRKNTLPTPLDEPMPTVIGGGNQQALVMTYNGNPVFASAESPLPAVSTVAKHGLILPDTDIDIDDVLFRMLKPRELANGTGFPEDYILWGSQKNQVKGIGGAVDPNMAALIGARIVEAVS